MEFGQVGVATKSLGEVDDVREGSEAGQFRQAVQSGEVGFNA